MKTMMRALLIVMVAAGAARAQSKDQLGAGVILGSPIGGTVKYWLSNTQAFDAGLGVSDHLVVYGDYLWQAWDILPKPNQGKLGLYAGFGPRLETEEDAEFGLRTIGGVNYWIQNRPIELFLEGGPVFEMLPHGEVDADIGLGIRFYFAGK